jgi:hypothetical protein
MKGVLASRKPDHLFFPVILKSINFYHFFEADAAAACSQIQEKHLFLVDNEVPHFFNFLRGQLTVFLNFLVEHNDTT